MLHGPQKTCSSAVKNKTIPTQNCSFIMFTACRYSLRQIIKLLTGFPILSRASRKYFIESP
jgi:hypothetical protein